MKILITRRGFIQSVSASALLSQTGCIFLLGLLRLGVRGSLLRSGARAARVSKRGTLASFGRAGATTMHLIRLSRAANTLGRMQKVGEIYGSETGDDAIDVSANDRLTECNVEGMPVSNTRPDGRWLVHHSNMFQESIGTSLATRETELVHRDSRNRFVGADVMENGAIRHIDQNQNLVGTTPLIISEETGTTLVRMPSSDYLESEFKQASNTIRSDHGDSLADSDSMRRAQEQCLQRPSSQSCDDLARDIEGALERLEKRFT
jgi:hypothetical protein